MLRDTSTSPTAAPTWCTDSSFLQAARHPPRNRRPHPQSDASRLKAAVSLSDFVTAAVTARNSLASPASAALPLETPSADGRSRLSGSCRKLESRSPEPRGTNLSDPSRPLHRDRRAPSKTLA